MGRTAGTDTAASGAEVIKLGMDTGQVVARFEAERLALGLMEHPNIARVLDAGATETGRPFFVMELVSLAGNLENRICRSASKSGLLISI